VNLNVEVHFTSLRVNASPVIETVHGGETTHCSTNPTDTMPVDMAYDEFGVMGHPAARQENQFAASVTTKSPLPGKSIQVMLFSASVLIATDSPVS
jgi:hypothetical protein